MGDTMIDFANAPASAVGAARNLDTNTWHWIVLDSEGNLAIGDWAADGDDNIPSARLGIPIVLRPPAKKVTISGTLSYD